LPHASVDVNVRVWLREQPSTTTWPSVKLVVTAPQLSDAVAEPSAASMSAAVGLHPSARLAPFAEMTGAVTSFTRKLAEQVL
jgi:hypothetical protein